VGNIAKNTDCFFGDFAHWAIPLNANDQFFPPSIAYHFSISFTCGFAFGHDAVKAFSWRACPSFGT